MNWTQQMISKHPKVFWAVDWWDLGPETCQSFPKMPVGIWDIEYTFNDSLIDTMFPVS